MHTTGYFEKNLRIFGADFFEGLRGGRSPPGWGLGGLGRRHDRSSFDDLHHRVLRQAQVAADQAIRQAITVHGEHLLVVLT
jgi:hypothetical protein